MLLLLYITASFIILMVFLGFLFHVLDHSGVRWQLLFLRGDFDVTGSYKIHVRFLRFTAVSCNQGVSKTQHLSPWWPRYHDNR